MYSNQRRKKKNKSRGKNIEGSNSKNWVGKVGYARKSNGGGIVR